MFQAFPLQMSLPALAVEGVRRVRAGGRPGRLAAARSSPGRTRAAGTSTGPGSRPPRCKVHTLLDGTQRPRRHRPGGGARPGRRRRPSSAAWSWPAWSSDAAPRPARLDPRCSRTTRRPSGVVQTGPRARGRGIPAQGRPRPRGGPAPAAPAAVRPGDARPRPGRSTRPSTGPPRSSCRRATRFVGIVGIDEESRAGPARRPGPRRHPPPPADRARPERRPSSIC